MLVMHLRMRPGMPDTRLWRAWGEISVQASWTTWQTLNFMTFCRIVQRYSIGFRSGLFLGKTARARKATLSRCHSLAFLAAILQEDGFVRIWQERAGVSSQFLSSDRAETLPSNMFWRQYSPFLTTLRGTTCNPQWLRASRRAFSLGC